MPLHTLSIISFAVSISAFMAVEIYVNVRHGDKSDRSRDGGTLKRIKLLGNASFIIGVAAFFFPVMPLPGGRDFSLITGAAGILAGSIIRFRAIARLEDDFSSVVTVKIGQKLVTDGPYRHVRHPAYSGALTFFLDYGIASGSAPALVLIMTLTGFAFFRRITVEEQVLAASFGDEYADYMKKTKKLIPYIY